MAGVLQHLRSSTLDKRPNPASMVDGQLAINYASGSPGAFFKDSNGNLVKVGPVHVGSGAPNASPASGGTAGNSIGEQWLDTSGGTYVFKIWDGAAWRSEAGEFVNSTGDTMTGALVMDNQQQVRFRETTANGTNYVALQAPASVASDKTITLPDVTGTVITTGDTGTVTGTIIASGTITSSNIASGTITSSNIADATIVDADISASAEIAVSKLADGAARQLLQTDAAGTGVEWTNNIDIPGTLDVTGAAVFDSTVNVTGAATVTGNLTVDTNTLFVDAANNRVGIGTTSPKSILTAAGNIVGLSTGTHSWQHYQQASSSYTVTSIDSVIDGAAGNLVFKTGPNWTNSDAVERARIDSSGRLLVGTSTTAGISRLTVRGNTVSDDGLFEVGHALGFASLGSGTSVGILRFTEATNSGIYAQIVAQTDGASGNSDYPGRLVFSTTADGASSPTERMRITNGGDIRIGTTGAVGTNVNGVDIVDNASSRLYRSGTTTTSSQNHFAFFNPNGVVGNISTSGSATAYATSSDYRLKENVIAITDGITRLQQLQPSRFNFIADPNKTVDGFIAHEVQAVVPEAITGTKDEVDADGSPVYQGIDQSKLVPLLTAALQEAIAKIESLEARLTAAGI